MRVDFGVTDWARFDDGQIIENPRWPRVDRPDLAALRHQRARKSKGPLRDKRLHYSIARLHERIASLRREFVHQRTA